MPGLQPSKAFIRNAEGGVCNLSATISCTSVICVPIPNGHRSETLRQRRVPMAEPVEGLSVLYFATQHSPRGIMHSIKIFDFIPWGRPC